MVSMLSLLIVLVFILGGVNILNYRGILDDADSVLTLLKKSGGRLPTRQAEFNWKETGPRFKSPELMFEARFFSVQLNDQGRVISTDMKRIAAVDTDEVEKYALRVLKKGDTRGFIDNYRYMRYDDGDVTNVLFLDCGRMLAGFRSVLLSSLGVSVLGLTAVLLLMIFLSERIVKPVSQSYEKQKRFITDAGHEIKTPITIIDADTELLEMEFGQSEWLDDIRIQAGRLSSLTNDLICLSRMEEAEKMQMIDFPVSDLVAETAASFQALALTGNKHMELQIQPSLTLHGNEKSIRQLIALLLDNALKYSTGEGNIVLRLNRQNKGIVLMVENEAEGISKETVQNMFERFYRGDPSRNSSVKGYGIGLSIVNAIVVAHKGKVRAETIDGNTLRITVSIPK